jgi:tetratricopeptide (TPR) repeat protein
MHRPTPPLRKWLIRMLLTTWLCSAFAAQADDLADVQRLYYSGQAAVAMERADKYIAAHPTDPQMRFMKGVMLADGKRNDEAIAVFQQIIQDYPDLAEPYNNLAALYATTGDYNKARVTLDQALRTNPSYATAHENLGDVYAALAAQSYSRALKLDPQNVTVGPKLALVRELYKRPGAADAASAPAASGAASGVASAAAPLAASAAAK